MGDEMCFCIFRGYAGLDSLIAQAVPDNSRDRHGRRSVAAACEPRWSDEAQAMPGPLSQPAPWWGAGGRRVGG